MKQTKQQRRAARQRKRAQHHPRTGDQAGRLLAEEVGHEWSLAIFRRAAGSPLPECVAALGAWPAALVEAVGEAYLCDLLAALARGGWTPVDLEEVARRRLERASRDCLRSAYGSQGVPPGIFAAAAERGLDRTGALSAVLDVLAALGNLPRLTEESEAVGPADPVEARMLAKVRALLSKAESTEFDAEAETLTAAAQKLMSRYSLDAAMVEHAAGTQQQVGVRRIWLDAPYVRAKSLLVSAVAAANRCRTVLVEHIGFVTVIGAPADLRTVELLSTSLLVQATRAMVSSGTSRSRSGVTRTRSFRQSFLASYAQRIKERLMEADRSALAETEDPRLLPVLSARSRAVDDRLEQLYPNAGSMGVSTNNGAGWAAGRAAADLALFEVGPLLEEARAG